MADPAPETPPDFVYTDDGQLLPYGEPPPATSAPAPGPAAPSAKDVMPGTATSGYQLNPKVPPMPMQDLSPDAKKWRRQAIIGAVTGNTAWGRVAEKMYSMDPSVKARGAAGEKTGEADVARGQAQDSAQRLGLAVDKMIQKIYEIPQADWDQALGKDNMREEAYRLHAQFGIFNPNAWNVPNMPAVEARARAYPTPENKRIFDIYDNWMHQVDAAAQSLLSSGGAKNTAGIPGLEVFKDMVQRVGQMNSRAAAISTAHDALDRIYENAGMPPREGSEGNPLIIRKPEDFSKVGVGEYWLFNDQLHQRSYVMPDEAMPPQPAIDELHRNPHYAEEFRSKYHLRGDQMKHYLPSYQEPPPGPASPVRTFAPGVKVQ